MTNRGGCCYKRCWRSGKQNSADTMRRRRYSSAMRIKTAIRTGGMIALALPTLIYASRPITDGGDGDIIRTLEDEPQHYNLRRATMRDGESSSQHHHDDIGSEWIIENEHQAEEERRRLQNSSKIQWWTDWYHSRCVQNCPKSPTNRHCAGYANWDQHLFNTPEFCCLVTLNWMSIEECLSPPEENEEEGEGEITALSSNMQTLGFNNIEVVPFKATTTTSTTTSTTLPEGSCPPPYTHLQTYESSSLVSKYLNPPTNTIGQIYKCKDNQAWVYCNIFEPGWTRESIGGGSIHSDNGSLGWEKVDEEDGGICTTNGEEVDPSLLQALLAPAISQVVTVKPSGGRPSRPVRPVASPEVEKAPPIPKGEVSPIKPTSSRPKPGTMQVQQAEQEEGCWRSGIVCDSHADEFACCTSCVNGYCT